MVRRIIEIDREKCNGCGACAAACHEGAIGMQDGKAVLTMEYQTAEDYENFSGTKIFVGSVAEALAALAVMLACPTAVSGYTLANQCGADGELAAQLIVVTTLFSVITMFLTIWLLTSMVLI